MFRLFDNVSRDSVLDTAAGVEKLKLAIKAVCPVVVRNIQLEQGCGSNTAKN
jgi:hypothetical protein